MKPLYCEASKELVCGYPTSIAFGCSSRKKARMNERLPMKPVEGVLLREQCTTRYSFHNVKKVTICTGESPEQSCKGALSQGP